MQIGDKVRFLNEVGGGHISAFQGKDIVLVKDEDGFDIPMLRSQVVVIDTNANNFVRKRTNAASPKSPGSPTPLAHGEGSTGTPSPAGSEARPLERKGGELLNVCLAFVPENSRELSNTRFEAYLVNDSNYFLSVVFSNNQGAAWQARWQATVEPNTKVLIESFDRSILNDLERLSVQLIAWKQDKPYMLKPAVGVELRLDAVKFYKLHVFQPSPFFRDPALIYDIVRDDRPIRQVFVEAEEVLDAMRGGSPLPPAANEADEAPLAEAPQEAGLQPEPHVRTKQENREALKAAKRALKAEMQMQKMKETAKEIERRAKEQKEERDPHVSKPNRHPEKEDIIEVDLHINALLDNINGLSPSVLLNTQLTEFRIIMDRNIRKKGQRIVFIHGKGEGVLREALVKELRHRYRNCTYEDASFQQYGFGATMVTIH